MPPNAGLLKHPSAIASIYAFFSLGWIFLTDIAVRRANLAPSAVVAIHIAKGSVFVVVTALLIYYLLKRQEQLQDQLAHSNIGLQEEVAARCEEIRTGEARYRRIVEHAEEGICEIDTNNFITFVNPKMAEMLGYRPEEVLGTSLHDYSPPEWHGKTEKRIDERKGRANLQYELLLLHKDGSDVWALINSAPIIVEGRYGGMTAMVTNITERKLAEVRLRKYASELAAVIDHAPYGIARTTADGRFLLVNPALVRMTQFDSAEALLNLPVAEIYANPAERDGVLKALCSAPTIDVESDWVRKDKTSFKVRLHCVRLSDKEFQITVEDISETTKLEKQIRMAAKMEAFGRLAGGIAHDFNNLLMVISSNLELVMLDGTLPASTQKRINGALDASNRAANLTSQLLAFTRQQVMQPSKVNLNEAVQQVTRMIERIIGEDIHVWLECSPLLGTVEVDRSQIEQVVMNLAVNARDAMPDGGTLFIETKNVTLGTDFVASHPVVIPGRYVMLIVRDTGMGMDSNTLSQIFEPFFTTKGPGRGTGLGLATTYGIVKQSRGYIYVDSEVGKGTSFQIYLPQVDAFPEQEHVESSLTTVYLGYGRVLVVEDDRMIRSLIAECLEGAGYQVLQAESVAEAIHIAREYKAEIRAVLTDMVLPDGNGRMVATKLSEIVPFASIICMSGYAPEVIVSQGMFNSDTNFLQKPFTRSRLLEMLSTLLSQRSLKVHDRLYVQ